MKPQTREAWIAERAFVALCIAAHRGHVILVQKLIEGGLYSLENYIIYGECFLPFE